MLITNNIICIFEMQEKSEKVIFAERHIFVITFSGINSHVNSSA